MLIKCMQLVRHNMLSRDFPISNERCKIKHHHSIWIIESFSSVRLSIFLLFQVACFASFERLHSTCASLVRLWHDDVHQRSPLAPREHVVWCCIHSSLAEDGHYDRWICLYWGEDIHTVDSLYLEHPLSRTSLYLELKSHSRCVSCNLFFSLYLELSLSRTNFLVPCEFEIERVNCISLSLLLNRNNWQ